MTNPIIDPISYKAGIEAAAKVPERILYVCESCADNDLEGCAHFDRRDVRVTPNGQWLCEGCFEGATFGKDDEEPLWRDLPPAPEYGPLPLPAPATDGEAEKLAERIERHINLMARTSMHLSLEQWGDIANDMLAAVARLRSPQWRKDIPDHLFWLIGKGRTRPTEPLYACQIIDPESGVAIAEAEHEELDQAVAKAVAAIPSRLRSQDRKDVSKP